MNERETIGKKSHLRFSCCHIGKDGDNEEQLLMHSSNLSGNNSFEEGQLCIGAVERADQTEAVCGVGSGDGQSVDTPRW